MKGKILHFIFLVAAVLCLHSISNAQGLLGVYEVIPDLDTINEDGTTILFVLENDNNETGFLDAEITGVTPPSHGSVLFDETTIQYFPDPDYNGSDDFTYTACANSNTQCDDGPIVITINPVPDFPIADDEDTSTYHITPVLINILKGDIDIDEDGLDVTIIDGGANGTSEYLGDSILKYTPDFLFLGDDVVTYQICNSGSDIYCDEGSVSITVIPNNFNKPNAANDFATVYANVEISIDVIANDYDGDGDAMEIGDLYIGDAFGIIAITDSNTISYISSEIGIDSFYYQVCDLNAPPKCDTAMVTVTVNEAPVVLPEIHVPNSISPNNDGFNDELEIVGLETYASFTLRIYNRWNDIVYETSDPEKVWNGRANTGLLAADTELPDGTYFYILQLQGEADPVRGFIVLKR